MASESPGWDLAHAMIHVSWEILVQVGGDTHTRGSSPPVVMRFPNRPVRSQLTGLTARQPQRAPVVVTTSGDQEDGPNTQPLLVGGGWGSDSFLGSSVTNSYLVPSQPRPLDTCEQVSVDRYEVCHAVAGRGGDLKIKRQAQLKGPREHGCRRQTDLHRDPRLATAGST